MQTAKETPVYLTNFNNLETGFRTMVDWFLDREMKITVFDNKSSYPPLLEYYQQMADKIDVVHVGFNGNTWVFWQSDFNTTERTAKHYITSDADCPPDPDCPTDLVEKMIAALDAVPSAKKVSPGIRIDNLPDWYDRKAQAIECQTGCSGNGPCVDTLKNGQPEVGDIVEISGLPKLRRAITDTTMTMWRGGFRSEGRLSTSDWQDEQYRMDYPYVVKHVPWYADSSRPTDESLFYRNCKDKLVGPVFGM